MEQYKITISPSVTNVFTAITQQHGIEMGCEEVLEVIPYVAVDKRTGEIIRHPGIMVVVVQVNDPNRRLREA